MLALEHRLCRRCGRQSPGGVLFCGTCGGSSWAPLGTAIRPWVAIAADPCPLPWPLGPTIGVWRPGSLALLTGERGCGKSTVCAQIFAKWPGKWITSEQSVPQVAALFARLRVPPPPIVEATGEAEIRRAVLSLPRGCAVVDSITEAGGWEEQIRLARAVDRWAGAGDERRAVLVGQLNGQGDVAGRAALAYLVDLVLAIGKRGGFRRLDASKNRDHGLRSCLFRLAEGGPELPPLPYAYSVEGEPGGYYLQPYPLSPAPYGGILEELAKRGRLPLHAAAAAIPVEGYPGGLYHPEDAAERREFAEAHGLDWIDTLDED